MAAWPASHPTGMTMTRESTQAHSADLLAEVVEKIRTMAIPTPRPHLWPPARPRQATWSVTPALGQKTKPSGPAWCALPPSTSFTCSLTSPLLSSLPEAQAGRRHQQVAAEALPPTPQVTGDLLLH